MNYAQQVKGNQIANNKKTVRKDGFFVEKIVVFDLFRQIIVFGRDAFRRVLGNDFL